MPFEVKQLYATPSWRKLIAVILGEFIGTLLLEFFGCMTLLGEINLLQVAIGWGTIVGHIVLIFGPISGAHLNPGVSVAATILGSLSPLMMVLYWISQVLGAIVGFALLKLLISNELWSRSILIRDDINFGICVTNPHNVSSLQATFLEFFGTCFLILIVCHGHDYRTEYARESFPIKVTITIISIIICIGEWTGASLNTARSIAPALLQNVWAYQWIYVLGPMSAGIITPLVYLLLWMPNRQVERIEGAVMTDLFAKLRKGPPPTDEDHPDEYS